jgi:hypothetical protein
MLRAAVASVLLLTLCVLPGRGSQEPSLAEVLKRAAVYVANFQKQLSGIVAEETYEQHIKKQASGDILVRRRRLKSDLLLVRPVGSGRYVEFRDVFEVDGRAVRDRQDRLTTLFLDPPPGAQSQLERVATESARFNIGRVFRTMNTPVLPLAILHADYQPQFSFTLVREPATDTMAIAFKETDRPTLVRTPGGGDLASRGRFWIDPATGAVTRSEFIVEDVQIKATVYVTYRTDADLGFMVPADMREAYVAGRDEIEGLATYGRFRKFQVNVDEQIKPVKQ